MLKFIFCFFVSIQVVAGRLNPVSAVQLGLLDLFGIGERQYYEAAQHAYDALLNSENIEQANSQLRLLQEVYDNYTRLRSRYGARVENERSKQIATWLSQARAFVSQKFGSQGAPFHEVDNHDSPHVRIPRSRTNQGDLLNLSPGSVRDVRSQTNDGTLLPLSPDSKKSPSITPKNTEQVKKAARQKRRY